jgi:hypothetical protein
MTIARLLAIALVAVSAGAAPGREDALVGALRWYYRWIAELPSTAKSVDCTVAAFPNSTFTYCEPGPLAIDLETPRGSPAIATNITRALSDFSDELTDFVNHRYSGPEQTPTITKFSVPASSLSACKVDIEETRRLAATAVGPSQRKRLLNRGITLRFPLACEEDPFYLVYFIKGDKLEWIWQIEPGVGPVWHYDDNGEQRRIPDVAIRNLAKPELWYDRR